MRAQAVAAEVAILNTNYKSFRKEIDILQSELQCNERMKGRLEDEVTKLKSIFSNLAIEKEKVATLQVF